MGEDVDAEQSGGESSQSVRVRCLPRTTSEILLSKTSTAAGTFCQQIPSHHDSHTDHMLLYVNCLKMQTVCCAKFILPQCLTNFTEMQVRLLLLV